MQTFTTKVAAEVAGVHQQTVIRWAKEGFIKPSVPRRKYEPRKYTEQDLAALMLANAAFDFGWPREEVAAMVKMAQKSDEKQQKNAAIVAFKGFNEKEGFVTQSWAPNLKDPRVARALKVAREGGFLLQQVSVYELVQSRLKIVRERYSEEAMREREKKTDTDGEDDIF
jgi:DNA-binding transcriptional MerR regulator